MTSQELIQIVFAFGCIALTIALYYQLVTNEKDKQSLKKQITEETHKICTDQYKAVAESLRRKVISAQGNLAQMQRRYNTEKKENEKLLKLIVKQSVKMFEMNNEIEKLKGNINGKITKL